MQGVLLAHVAMTGFTLPHNDNAHSLSPSMFAISAAAALLAVYLSNVSRKRLDACNRAADIRFFLCASAPTASSPSGGSPGPPPLHERRRRNGTPHPSLHPIITHASASKSTALVLAMPSALLQFSVSCIILALAIYHGSVWLRQLNSANSHAKTTFCTYIGGTLSFIALYYVPSTIKDMERERLVRGWPTAGAEDPESAVVSDEDTIRAPNSAHSRGNGSSTANVQITTPHGSRKSPGWRRHSAGSRREKDYRK